jgi:hypothetical protein
MQVAARAGQARTVACRTAKRVSGYNPIRGSNPRASARAWLQCARASGAGLCVTSPRFLGAQPPGPAPEGFAPTPTPEHVLVVWRAVRPRSLWLRGVVPEASPGTSSRGLGCRGCLVRAPETVAGGVGVSGQSWQVVGVLVPGRLGRWVSVGRVGWSRGGMPDGRRSGIGSFAPRTGIWCTATRWRSRAGCCWWRAGTSPRWPT